MKKKNEEIDFKAFIDNKKLPILVLDPKWHELLPEDQKTTTIRNLEKKLNELLKLQGKLVNDMKDMKKLKMKLMEQIVQNMGESSESQNDKKRMKKQEASQKMILELNEKLESSNDELLDVPYKIRQVNEELAVECVKYWYANLSTTQEHIKALDNWILQTREKLKERILEKQELEERSTGIYSYMHNLLGSDIIDKFDNQFVGEKK